MLGRAQAGCPRGESHDGRDCRARHAGAAVVFALIGGAGLSDGVLPHVVSESLVAAAPISNGRSVQADHGAAYSPKRFKRMLGISVNVRLSLSGMMTGNRDDAAGRQRSAFSSAVMTNAALLLARLKTAPADRSCRPSCFFLPFRGRPRFARRQTADARA